MKTNVRALFLLSVALISSTAHAGVGYDELVDAGMPPGFAEFGEAVSRSEGTWTSVNQSNCVGAFQFCEGTFEMYYDGTREQFLQDPNGQVDAWMGYQKSEWDAASRLGMTDAIGKEVCYDGRCTTITSSSILYACQFGCQSLDGKLGHYLETGDCYAKGAMDGNDVSVCEYLIRGTGYDVSDLTGMTEEDLMRMNDTGAGLDPDAFFFPLMRWNDS